MDINIYCTKDNDKILYNFIILDMNKVIIKVENLTLDELLTELTIKLGSVLKECKYGYTLLNKIIELK